MTTTVLVKNEKTHVILSVIAELIIIGFLGVLLLWISNNYIFQHPSKPTFRIIGSVAQILILLLFLLIKSPSVKDIGLSWQTINSKYRIYYIIGLSLICILLISGCFFMPAYAITMNIRFGIMAPIFEEIIFRGYIWHRLKQKQFDDISIILITALFFGLFHLAGYYEINYVTNLFSEAPSIQQIMRSKVLANIGYGFFLGFLRYKSKNLYLPLIVHSIGNIIGH